MSLCRQNASLQIATMSVVHIALLVLLAAPKSEGQSDTGGKFTRIIGSTFQERNKKCANCPLWFDNS